MALIPSLSFRSAKQQAVTGIHKLWILLNYIITWTPALRNNFSSKESKKAFIKYLYVIYKPLLIRAFFANAVLQAIFLLIYHIYHFKHHHFLPETILGNISIIFHVMVIVLNRYKPNLFKKFYLLAIFISIFLMLYNFERVIAAIDSAEIILLYGILNLMTITVYFLNSTVLTLLFACIRFGLVLLSYHLLSDRINYPGNNFPCEEVCTFHFLSTYYYYSIFHNLDFGRLSLNIKCHCCVFDCAHTHEQATVYGISKN